MNIVFDFDHTIFDMMAMHEALYQAMHKLGVPREVYDNAYLAVTHWKMFTPQAFAHRLHKEAGLRADQALEAMQSVASRSRDFLYPDTLASMQKLREAGHKLYILTWGEENWQRSKVRYAGLEPLCEGVYCLQTSKQDFLGGWVQGKSDAVLVDDKPAEIIAVREAKVPMRLVRMRRAKAKYADQDTPHGMEEVRDMEGLLTLLSGGK